MKKNLVKFVLLMSVLLGVTSCQKTETREPVQYPSDIALGSLNQVVDIDDINVHLYFDNTDLIKGYITQVDDKYDNFLTALVNTNNACKSSHTYLLQKHNQKEYSIKKYNGDLLEEYWDYDFYVGSKEKVASFFRQSPEKPEELNVYFTDLEEFKVKNTQLATNLNKDVLARDGYSACILAMSASYNGEWPVLQSNGSYVNKKINGSKPIYLVMTGKDEELMQYTKTLTQYLAGNGLDNGEEYYTNYYRPDETVEAIDFEAMMTSAIYAGYDKNIAKEDWAGLVLSSNMSVTELDVDTVLKSDDFIDIFAFAYDKNYKTTIDGTKCGKMVLNFYIPLKTQEWDNWTYEKNVTPNVICSLINESEEYADIYAQREYFKAYTANLEGAKSDMSVEDVWTNLPYKEFAKKITVKEPVIIKKGEIVYEYNVEGIEARPVFEAETDMIQITIESTGDALKMENDTLLFNIPIYAYVEPTITIPQWVKTYERSVSNTIEGINGTTSNLESFYKSLFSITTVIEDEDFLRESRMAQIANLTVVITDIPEK